MLVVMDAKFSKMKMTLFFVVNYESDMCLLYKGQVLEKDTKKRKNQFAGFSFDNYNNILVSSPSK